MNSEVEILDLAARLTTYAWYIDSNHYCNVYFSNCVVCGAATSSKQPTKITCSQKCATFYFNHVLHKKHNTMEEMLLIPTVKSSTGVRGVIWDKKVRKGSISKYVTSRIMVGGKDTNLYHGDDFFEACCARKSAESSFIKGERIRKHKHKRKKIIVIEPMETGIKGVFVRANRYSVCANINGTNKTLGRFTDFFEACCARKSAEAKFRKPRVQNRENTEFGIIGVYYVGEKYRSRINVHGKTYNSTHDDLFEACCARKSAENSIKSGSNVRMPRYKKKNIIGIKRIDTRIKGVRATENRYVANISISGKIKRLGRFTDFFEACCARKSAEAKPKKYRIGKARDNKLGIVGIVKYNEKYRSRIIVHGKTYSRMFDDFFEACCARKSAEARIAQGTFVN